VLKAEERAPGGRFAALDLQRLALLLGKYRELERASGFAAMHKSKQAEVRAAAWGSGAAGRALRAGGEAAG
jgi:hypothetical protein